MSDNTERVHWRELLADTAEGRFDAVVLTTETARQVLNAITAAEAVEARVSERLRAVEGLAAKWTAAGMAPLYETPGDMADVLRCALRGDQ